MFCPSSESVKNSMRFQEMTEKEIVDEYINYPLIPYNKTIKIDKIGMINFNCLNKQPTGLVQYKTFRTARPDLFPICKKPEFDFEDHDQVTPAVIISGDDKYRVDQKIWYPLSDIVAAITRHQAVIGKKLLPIEVFVDERDQWLVPLFNLTRTSQ